MRWRDLTGGLIVVLGLGAFGGFAWMTRHPDSALVRRAESWPGVGPWVTRFRELYGAPEPALQGVELAREGPAIDLRSQASPASRPPPTGKRLWVLPGTVLRRRPTPRSEVLEEIGTIVSLPELERRGRWAKVWRAGVEGWVLLPEDEDKPPFGSEPEPPTALPPRPPDRDVLDAARRLLRNGEQRLTLGPYALYTDCRDASLLALLSRVAAQLDDVYAARYGVRPQGAPQEAVVLYEREAAYRFLALRNERLAGLEAAGHNTSGLAVLFAGRRSPPEVAATLIHELSHLVTRRALGPALPPWIDEGIADDLALSPIDTAGRIVAGQLGGAVRFEADRRVISGGEASLELLREALAEERLPPVRRLLELEWSGFVRTSDSGLHYAASAFWVRFLLTGEGGRHAPVFRAFLAAVSRGGEPWAEELRRRLGRGWPALDAAFRAWLEAQGTAEEAAAGGTE